MSPSPRPEGTRDGFGNIQIRGIGPSAVRLLASRADRAVEVIHLRGRLADRPDLRPPGCRLGLDLRKPRRQRCHPHHDQACREGQVLADLPGLCGLAEAVVYPDVVGPEEYMLLSRQASKNDGAESIYTDEYIANYRKNNYLDPDAFPIIDWQDRLMTGNGFTHNHTVNMSAGNDRIG